MQEASCGNEIVDLLSTVRLVYERNLDITRKPRDNVVEEVVRRSTNIATYDGYMDRLLELVHNIEQFRKELSLALLHKPTLEDISWDSLRLRVARLTALRRLVGSDSLPIAGDEEL